MFDCRHGEYMVESCGPCLRRIRESEELEKYSGVVVDELFRMTRLETIEKEGLLVSYEKAATEHPITFSYVKHISANETRRTSFSLSREEAKQLIEVLDGALDGD
jgi:hypothetical protein